MFRLMVGQMLYGYCAGYFGRDSYCDKRVEAVGADWVVVRCEDGSPNFAYTGDNDDATGIHEGLREFTVKGGDYDGS